MPELRMEKIYQDGVWRDKQAMILPNGAKLVALGGDRELAVYFRYIDQRFKFEFRALRWDERLEPQDYWAVSLGFGLESISAKTQGITLDDIGEIAENIRTALFAWPPAKREAPVPIKEVKFLMTPWKLWQSQDPYLQLPEVWHGR